MKTKIMNILGILLIIALIAGCSGSKNIDGPGNAQSNEGTEGNDTNVNEEIEFPLKEAKTLSILTSAYATSTQNPEEKIIYQRLKDKTNVNIDWTCYVTDQFVEKRNLMLATGDLPDVILNADMSSLDLLKYGNQGIIVPLEDLIEDYMPNLSKILEDNPSYRKSITDPAGHIYAFPWIEQLGTGKEAIQAIGGMPFINKDWLDQLGLDMPRTTKELEDVLMAFKENIQGAIPMSFIINGGNEDLGVILGAFGYGDNPDHIVINEENQVVYSVTDEGYKEGIKWLHSLSEKGLIDPEAFTQDWGTLVAKGKNDQYGLYFGWDNLGIPGTASSYVPLPALKGPEGIVNITRSNGTENGGFQLGRAVITSDCDNLELAAKWIDLMYDPIQSIQNNWGTYGEEGKDNVFELTEEGTLVHTPIEEFSSSPWEVRTMQMVGGPLAILDKYYGVYTTMPQDAMERMDYVKSYVDDMKYDRVYPNVFMSEEDSNRMAELETGIKEYAEQMKATWILAGNVDSEWQEYLDKLDKLGLQEYLGLKQKYLDAYLAENDDE